MAEEGMSEHLASLADDGGLADALEDRIAAQADYGPDEQGFLDSGESEGEPPADEAEPVIVETADEGVATLETMQEEIDTLRKESDGRLTALVDNRDKMRQANDGIESMRQLMQEWEQRANAPEVAKARQQALVDEYGVEVVGDPSNRYITDQLNQFEQRQEYNRQVEDGRKRQVAMAVQSQSAERSNRQQAYNAVAVQEQEFLKEKPDYADAYAHMRKSREAFYQNAYPGQNIVALMDREEEVIVAETLHSGGNVAQKVYDMATQFGYQPKEVESEGVVYDPDRLAESEVRKERIRQFRADNESPDINKLKAAQKNAPLRGGTSNRGGNSKVLKWQQVFDQLPKAKRMEIFADPERFKRFVLTGNVEMD